jgi:four helix bundle protein
MRCWREEDMTNAECKMQNAKLKHHDIYDRTFEFACRIVRLHRRLVRDRTAGPLALQLLRSGTGIAANLEEAEAGQSKADFIAKCRISLKEARETHYWLRLFAATEIMKAERLQSLIAEVKEIVAILTTIIRKASQSPHR